VADRQVGSEASPPQAEGDRQVASEAPPPQAEGDRQVASEAPPPQAEGDRQVASEAPPLQAEGDRQVASEAPPPQAEGDRQVASEAPPLQAEGDRQVASEAPIPGIRIAPQNRLHAEGVPHRAITDLATTRPGCSSPLASGGLGCRDVTKMQCNLDSQWIRVENPGYTSLAAAACCYTGRLNSRSPALPAGTRSSSLHVGPAVSHRCRQEDEDTRRTWSRTL